MDSQYATKILLKNVIIVLMMGTVWYPDNISYIKDKLFRIYVYVIRIFLIIPYVLMQLINGYMVFGDLEKFAEATFVLITVILECTKAMLIFWKQYKIKQMIVDFDNDALMPRTMEEREIYSVAYKKGNILFWVLLYMYNSTVVFWGIFSFFDDQSYSLPIPAWYPFETNTTYVYPVVYFQQCAVSSLMASMDVAFDIMAVFLITLISIRVDILLHRLSGGFGGYLEYLKIKDNLEVRKMTFLKECAFQHDLIIQYANRLTEILKYTVIIQYTISSLVICMTLFQASVQDPSSLDFLSTVVYQACMIAQLFLYSWFGNEMSLKCSKIPDAAYFSDWYEQGVKYCRTLKFIMMRATIPVSITGAHFFTLSLNLFTSILRSSWSYFALLRQVHDED